MTKPVSKSLPKSPRIPRFIAEMPQQRWFFYSKIGIFSLITTVLLVTIILRGYELFQGIQVLQAATHQREDLVNEQKYWQGVIERHPGYRDAEFRLAVLSYELGNKAEAKIHLDQALTIDPNFQQGRDFAHQVGL